MMKKKINGIVYDMTDEEIAEMKENNKQSEKSYWSIPYAEAVNREIRKRYTVSDELGILRQQAEKPEEYAEYFKYCEECKTLARKHIKK